MDPTVIIWSSSRRFYWSSAQHWPSGSADAAGSPGPPSSATSSTTQLGRCTTPTCSSWRSCAGAATRSKTSTAAPTTTPLTHPDVVHHYRQARRGHDASVDRPVDTERQRRALTSYRLLPGALDRATDRTTHTENSNHPASDTRPTEERSR